MKTRKGGGMKACGRGRDEDTEGVVMKDCGWCRDEDREGGEG